MLTHAAVRTEHLERSHAVVMSRAELYRSGCTPDRLRAQLAARGWQQTGLAVVLHNGAMDLQQRWDAAVLNCGPRAVLASFTALQSLGVTGWTRDSIHVLVPVGVGQPTVCGLRIHLHRTARIRPDGIIAARRVQRVEDAAVLAASSFPTARPACGVIAAVVQQRLSTPTALRAALARSARARHRHQMLLAIGDIEGGAHSLAEIDFARLCRRYNLPPPTRQSLRRDASGRNRWLDVEWVLPDGRRVVVEVDGAFHTTVQNWTSDQLRQNAVSLSASTVLRYPSVVVRSEPDLVAVQLAEALGVSLS